MKFPFVFGFILLILLVIGVFVGLPYAVRLSKSGLFSLPFYLPFSLPKISVKPPARPPIVSSGVAPAPKIFVKTKTGESPYKGQISISVGFFRLNTVNLRTSFLSSGGINITGFKIKSAQEGEMVIGKGIGLPQLFRSVPSDILLSGGESVDIVAGQSPLTYNFRANDCFGWLSDIYNLDSSLDYCPGSFKAADLTELDSACQELIIRSGSCKALSADDLNRHSSECRAWAEKNMNYTACVASHKNDYSFYKEWKIYSGREIFDPLHDRIELFDQNGLLVDSYEY